METLYKSNSGVLVNGKYYAFPTFSSLVYMDGENVTLKDFLDSVGDALKTAIVTYTITVPSTGWSEGSLKWGGVDYTRKCTIAAPDATQDPILVQMFYAGGDHDSYCQVGVIDTGSKQVTLWAQNSPASTCQIKVLEVRSIE